MRPVLATTLQYRIRTLWASPPRNVYYLNMLAVLLCVSLNNRTVSSTVKPTCPWRLPCFQKPLNVFPLGQFITPWNQKKKHTGHKKIQTGRSVRAYLAKALERRAKHQHQIYAFTFHHSPYMNHNCFGIDRSTQEQLSEYNPAVTWLDVGIWPPLLCFIHDVFPSVRHKKRCKEQGKLRHKRYGVRFLSCS